MAGCAAGVGMLCGEAERSGVAEGARGLVKVAVSLAPSHLCPGGCFVLEELLPPSSPCSSPGLWGTPL